MGKHKEWRKLAKKLRRKKIRRTVAVKRDEDARRELERKESSPTYIAWLEEQKALEAFTEQEEERLAAERDLKWFQEEVAAQERWRQQMVRLERARAEKAKQEVLIREEWEREQNKLKEEQERKEIEKEEKKKIQEELFEKIEAFISGRAELPTSTVVNTESQPGQPSCPFFSKTGACRFRDNCSRNHVRPGISKVLLITNFYEHFGIQSSLHNEYDTDVGLEFDDSDTYNDFLEFYNDILPEFESCGEVRQLKVCCNSEPHLRGNVYVEYYSERNAMKAFQMFHGRYFGGRQLSVTFTRVPSWNSAICGLFHKQKCPKGRTCNFLHVFRNPNNNFRDADFDRSPRHTEERSSQRKQTSSPEKWRWSESPERPHERDVSNHRKSRSQSNRKRHGERDRERRSSKENKDSVSLKRKRRKRSRSKTRHNTESSRHKHHKNCDSDNDEQSRFNHHNAKRKSKHKRCSDLDKSVNKTSERKPKEERTPESG